MAQETSEHKRPQAKTGEVTAEEARLLCKPLAKTYALSKKQPLWVWISMIFRELLMYDSENNYEPRNEDIISNMPNDIIEWYSKDLMESFVRRIARDIEVNRNAPEHVLESIESKLFREYVGTTDEFPNEEGEFITVDLACGYEKALDNMFYEALIRSKIIDELYKLNSDGDIPIYILQERAKERVNDIVEHLNLFPIVFEIHEQFKNRNKFVPRDWKKVPFPMRGLHQFMVGRGLLPKTSKKSTSPEKMGGESTWITLPEADTLLLWTVALLPSLLLKNDARLEQYRSILNDKSSWNVKVYYAKCLFWYLKSFLWNLPSFTASNRESLLFECSQDKKKDESEAVFQIAEEDGIIYAFTQIFTRTVLRNKFLKTDEDIIKWRIRHIARDTHKYLAKQIGPEIITQLKNNNGQFDSEFDWNEEPFDFKFPQTQDRKKKTPQTQDRKKKTETFK